MRVEMTNGNGEVMVALLINNKAIAEGLDVAFDVIPNTYEP